MGNTENQRAVFDFLVARYKSKERFTKAEMEAQTTWRGKTFSTYWTKLYEQFVLASEKNSFRVGAPRCEKHSRNAIGDDIWSGGGGGGLARPSLFRFATGVTTCRSWRRKEWAGRGGGSPESSSFARPPRSRRRRAPIARGSGPQRSIDTAGTSRTRSPHPKRCMLPARSAVSNR